MVSSKASTVEAYLEELPPERREVIASVRDLVNAHLPEGYEETMAHGMIAWVVPLSRFAGTVNGQPLSYAALAAQKNNYALYLMCDSLSANDGEKLRAAYARAGRRLDMGKSCLRFKRRADLFDEAVAELIAATSVEETIRRHESTRKRP
ncbi:DUF1801 domain-containing protein [Dokdonella sp.]|uniref:DUF1801 domain-containing protein n=1 Tax=Dokdonella sp. TaxID=2291710 RepID=UPI003527C179